MLLAKPKAREQKAMADGGDRSWPRGFTSPDPAAVSLLRVGHQGNLFGGQIPKHHEETEWISPSAAPGRGC